jgi:3-methyladenine DNA glycosylase Tag
MISIESLIKVAEQKKSGRDQLAASLPEVAEPDQLRDISDDRYLSEMSRCVFRAGFSWQVIDKKWPDFETVFAGFNPRAIAHYSDDRLAELIREKRIVRHGAKIKSVRDNAAFICDVQESHGSFASFVAAWPISDITGLWLTLKKRGSRLGGNTGPMSLRQIGKDTFILSVDVQAALINHRLVDSLSPNSKRDLTAVQKVFNRFHEESGYPLAHLSRILALTV